MLSNITPQSNKHVLRTYLKDLQYTRKLRLAEYFYEEDNSEIELEEYIVRNISYFNPKKGEKITNYLGYS